MSTLSIARATLDDLLHVEGKAELIGGRIVRIMANGFLPGLVAGEIFVSLRQHAKSVGRGVALGDGVGYAVPELPSGRESFSPDASYYVGQLPASRMRFIEGPPTFAVEIRSENDYGKPAETEMALKRADYFAAGTLVVWDVDPEEQSIAVYRFDHPEAGTVFRQGQSADAEPAVPGWRIGVADLFST